jgi:hypothetical protein
MEDACKTLSSYSGEAEVLWILLGKQLIPAKTTAYYAVCFRFCV